MLGFLKGRIKQVEYAMNNPHELQDKIFKNLVQEARDTAWGKKYGYKSISSVQEYRNRVPLSSYEDISPWIDRIIKGEQNVLWSSPIHWFSKSSGTTNSKSKFIPVSKESLEDIHYKGGKDLISVYVHNNPDSRMFSGKGLAIGGSYSENPSRPDSYYGDVSAVIMANLPVWAQYVRTPSLKVATMSEWEKKIEYIAADTLREKVTNISGVPTWTIVLLEKIMELSGKDNMLEVWPEMEVFFHGAVAFPPYRAIFEKLFPKPGIHYMETYNASEGFFGIQDRLNSDELMLMVDYGIYYEFIPVDQAEDEDPEVLSLEQVEEGKIYSMVISTNGGLWRYKIGDTIKFTSVNPYRIKIAGRTKHFINAFGEELMIENAESAITSASQRLGARVINFTAGPVYFGDGSRGGHEWIIEFQEAPKNLEEFTIELDNALKSVNSDYEAKRYKDMALGMPVIHVAEPGTFYKWMRKKGKLGGQNKVPRLSNNREFLDELLPLVKDNQLMP